MSAKERGERAVLGPIYRAEARQERRMSATQTLARVLGFDHGDRVECMNLTQEPSWTSWR